MTFVPQAGAPQAPTLPALSERILPSGLRILAARRAGVPRVEARLRVPFAVARSDGARERLLAEALTAGTSERSAVALAEELQRLGASLHASASADELVISGGCLLPSLRAFLELVAEVLTAPAFDDAEVGVHKARTAQEIVILRSQPTVVAQETLLAQLYRKHPYGRGLPPVESVEAVKPEELRRLHTGRVVPGEAVLVLVGDVEPDVALEEAAAALEGWAGTSTGAGVDAPPSHQPGPTTLVDRPGSVQTNIRMGGPVVGRDHPDHARIQAANMIFGGYFSSRLVANIREDKGYSYSPRSSITHKLKASYLTVAAEVATEVTVPAVLEIRYELARMSAGRVSEEELEAARRYMVGNLALAVQTQAGLASAVAGLVSAGLGPEYLEEYPARLSQVQPDDLLDVALRYLAARALTTVLVGDASAVQAQIDGLDAVDVI